MPNVAPTVKAAALSLNASQSVAAQSLLGAVVDANGDKIASYRFMDNGASGGYFTLNGIKQAAGQWLTVSAADLAKLVWVGNGSSASETISVQASDGKAWSASATTTITTTNHAANVTTNNVSVDANKAISAASLIGKVTDADGDTITQYRFFDNGSGGGYFTLNGVKQAAGQWITVTAADLAKLSYVASGASASETVSIQAYDGKVWSSSATSTVTTVNHAATVTVNSATINANQTISASSLLKSVTDVDGDTITQYRFIDNGAGGSFVLNGVKIASGQWITINASDLSKLSYVGGASTFTDTFSVQAFDGKVWSATATGSIATIEHAPVVAASTTSLSIGAKIAASSLISSVSDADGDKITQYRFMDNGTSGGHFELGGVTIGSGQWITINAADLAKLVYVGGAIAGSETFSLQAFDGQLWSSVSTGTLTTQSLYAGITDAGVLADVQAGVKNGAIDYNGLLKILKDAAVGGITASEFASLQAVDTLIGKSGTSISTSSYLDGIFHDLVAGNKANATWTGGGSTSVALGNLSSTTTETQMNELIGKWFLGTDLPTISTGYGSAYKATSISLWNSTGTPSYMDVNQGLVGDCYLMSSLAEIALHDPNSIKSMIVDNGNNTWGVRFFDTTGAAHWVTVDNELATMSTANWANGSKLEYANGSVGWVALVEKAYAEYNAEGYLPRTAANSYSAIAGGWGDPITEVTGKSVSYFTAGSQSILSAYNAGQEIMLATSSTVGGNLVGNHMYEVTGYDSASGNVHLHNPWNTAVNNPAVIDLWVSTSDLAKSNCTFVVANGTALA